MQFISPEVVRQVSLSNSAGRRLKDGSERKAMRSQRAVAHQRRTTAAAVKQRALAFLAEALPRGWMSQPLAPGFAQGAAAARARACPAASGPAADILVISPRGRCHFLFVRAPADRWWDGGPKSVPAEEIGEREAEMARQLRAAGHRARAIWGERDLLRALRSWGCPLPPELRIERAEVPARPPQRAAPRRQRPVLHLGSGGGRLDG